jgi:hypothetical protein
MLINTAGLAFFGVHCEGICRGKSGPECGFGVSPVPAGRQHGRTIYHCQSRSLR